MTTVAPAPTTCTPQSVPHRDVVVWGTAGCAYTVTDGLRAAGLSVGSWLMPHHADAGRAQAMAARLHDDVETRRWRHAPVIVSVWQDQKTARALAADMRIAHAGNSPAVHIDLSPAAAPQVTAATVRAPLVLDWIVGRAYLDSAGHQALTAAIQWAPPAATRVLRALATLPRRAGHLS